ncbi:unnamed protein product [Linum tenue]|uniref:non-specific serine/threonine protein kinase n=1 Tax=Linum tenue TaxID=586396 RepID=A0AAV0J4U9_9ROSI|nr:unnamed protein product [Linum tenue]
MKMPRKSIILLTTVYYYILLFSPLINFLVSPANAYSSSSANETDRLALIEFRKAITSDPNGFFQSWNDSVHFCNWAGISCGGNPAGLQRVRSLEINQQDLVGTLSPHIGNLSFLQAISLDNNTFKGGIPAEIGNLLNLQELNITRNSLDGELPDNITQCSELRIIRLHLNHLQGRIPLGLGSLSKLEVFRINDNNMTGEIPASVGNLSNLIEFAVSFINLVGTVPESLGNLRSLYSISLAGNQLTGPIPRSLFNSTTLRIIALPWNQFSGSLPEDIGFTVPNLQQFAISKNKFVGQVPKSFCNVTGLQVLDMNKNGFTGRIPNCLGNLARFTWLSVGVNRLGSYSAADFEFLTGLQNCTQLQLLVISGNNFGGNLPDSIANLSVQLTRLSVAHNQLTGEIPSGLEKFINLNDLELNDNLFRGMIPSYFSKFPNLQSLHLEGNQLSGQIPATINNLTQLSVLDVSDNRLEGVIPSGIRSFVHLNYLDVSGNTFSGTIPGEVFSLPSLTKLLNLSNNEFTGNLPPEIGKLHSLIALDVSHNLLMGPIPNSIGDCKSLEFLYLQGNSFNRSIPPSLASLKSLEVLDLSLNNLRGEIPLDLQNISALQYLNLSFNHLEGQVPREGIFSNASNVSLVGNTMLCGGVLDFHLPKCPTYKVVQRHGISSQRMRISLTVISVLVGLVSMLSLLLILKARMWKKKPPFEYPILPTFMRVSYRDLSRATDGFSSDCLIGSGSFGVVYKGKLNETDPPVAIKVLNLKQRKAYKSLAAECNALRSIRHRNLVSVVSFCSSLDNNGNEFRALVFEYMPNGSLEKWLHPMDGSLSLSLIQRLNIAIDVASALHYLHDLCETSIVHCDLKPSNVLLDESMVAHLCDFGIARILSAEDTSYLSSTIGIKGTIGYTPPEYGMGSVASKEGDVYSFGILLLEMFSGKRPTDQMFGEGRNLREFVMAGLPDLISVVLDPLLLPGGGDGIEPTEGEGSSNEITEAAAVRQRDSNLADERLMRSSQYRNCMISAVEIGIACSMESPAERMKTAEVSLKLQSIREVFLASTVRRSRARPALDPA